MTEEVEIIRFTLIGTRNRDMHSNLKKRLIITVMLALFVNLLGCSSEPVKTTNENIYLQVVNPVNTNILNEAKISSSLAHNYFLKGKYKDALKAYQRAINNLTKIGAAMLAMAL